MSRPTYVGPGSILALPGRHISFSGQNSRLWAGIQRFWPFLARISLSWVDLGHSQPALAVFGLRLGPCSGVPDAAHPLCPGRLVQPRLGLGPRSAAAGLAFSNRRLGRISPSIPAPRGWAGVQRVSAGPAFSSPRLGQISPPSRFPAAGPACSEPRLGRFKSIPA
jgi:hypothetical protein